MVEVKDLLKELLHHALHGRCQLLGTEKFLEAVQVQMDLDQSNDLFAAVSKVEKLLGACALSVNEDFYAMIFDYFGFKYKATFHGVWLSSVDVLFGGVSSQTK